MSVRVSSGVQIVGTNDLDHIAAVLVALATRRGERVDTTYQRWREQRMAALRASRER